MPRIRTIKPEACTSKTLTKCSRDARLFFHLLSTHLDDKGRTQCLYKKLAGDVFPHDDDVTAADVKRWIEELESADYCLRRYEVNGDEFLCAPKFRDHQVINKPTPSRIPPPPWEASEPTPVTIPEPPQEPHKATTLVTTGATTVGTQEPLPEDSGSDPGATTGTGNRKEEVGNRKETSGVDPADQFIPRDGLTFADGPTYWETAHEPMRTVALCLCRAGKALSDRYPSPDDVIRHVGTKGYCRKVIAKFGWEEAADLFVWCNRHKPGGCAWSTVAGNMDGYYSQMKNGVEPVARSPSRGSVIQRPNAGSMSERYDELAGIHGLK